MTAGWRAVIAVLQWLFLAIALASPALGDDAPASFEAGLRIYRGAIAPSGAPLAATGQNGISLRGAEAACANCHLRSGYGTAEGRSVVRPLPPLFDNGWMERSALRARPVGSGRPALAYTAESLAKALRAGIDAAGRPLDSLMPRYEIDDASVAALHKYLAAMSVRPASGVSATSLRFATVVTPEAEPARADAMLRVLRAFFADKNGGSRSESRRRAAGSEWMYQGYRKWELDVWELRGAPQTWAAQLEGFHRDRPAFALLSGLGAGRWDPVHAFCERFEVPCILPNASASRERGDFYSVYFARGLEFEGTLVARHLQDAGGAARPVVQVYRSGEQGGEAARALRGALPDGVVFDIALDAGSPVAPALRSAARQGESGFTLVLWLDREDLAALPGAAPALGGAHEIYVSATLAPPDRLQAGAALQPRLRVVHPFDLPQARAPRLARARAWFDARHIVIEDEGLQANTFFAATLVADALGHMVDIHSREYLVERIEHMAGRMPNTSTYPRISLAPGQRYASKGGYIARFSAPGMGALEAASDWIVP